MRRILFFAVAAAAMLTNFNVSAEETTNRNDSIATALRLNSLQAKRDKLQAEIKTQDSKRNRQLTGVSVETMEEMNERQDSLCLSLRSELVDVLLEIKELTPSFSSPLLIQQYNNLVHKKDKPEENQGIPTDSITGKQAPKKQKK